jgi:hypothetical protein
MKEKQHCFRIKDTCLLLQDGFNLRKIRLEREQFRFDMDYTRPYVELYAFHNEFL